MTPVLCTRMSRLPNVVSIFAAAASTLFWSTTSILICRTFGAGFPAAFAPSSRAFSVLERSERAPIAILVAPAWAYEMAMAWPMPLEAPTMKTLLFWRLAFLESMAG